MGEQAHAARPVLKYHLRQVRAQLPYIPKALHLVWVASRPWTAAWAVMLVAQGAVPVCTAFAARALVNSLAMVVRARPAAAPPHSALLWGALLAVTLLLSEVLRSLSTWVRSVQAELVHDCISERIHSQALALDLAFYDSPASYDLLHRARVDAIGRPVALLETVGSVVQNGITLVAMSVVLARFGLLVPVLLALSTIPALAVAVHFAVKYHTWRARSTADVRRTQYLDWMITQQPAAAELRLFALGPHLITSFQTLRRRLRGEQAALSRREAVATIMAAVFGLGITAWAVVWMAERALHGTATMGDLTLFVLAFSQGQGMMRASLAGAGEMYKSMAFLENLFEFLALEPGIAEGVESPVALPTTAPTIEVNNITFRYPGTERLAVENFSLTIPSGAIVALVGENGAGKSTLVKLLCRFYDPTSGSITIDGMDLRTVSPTDLRRQITVLFQEPVHYHDSVANNISYGDIAAQADLNSIMEAATDAGADTVIGRLPLGYDTVLGKWFGGYELSVGEWQRVALARAFLRRASLIILDEPTSAMDSWCEADWMARFRSLVAGRTALIITHRFTTALQADVIHVVQKGQIVESGSHINLVALNGLYAQSWATQMAGGRTAEVTA